MARARKPSAARPDQVTWAVARTIAADSWSIRCAWASIAAARAARAGVGSGPVAGAVATTDAAGVWAVITVTAP
ncbi:MAG: hypothetical protein HOV87_14920 [Catenulispora sp.]|nr:hypothetical protein [Catenulispora sp.]